MTGIENRGMGKLFRFATLAVLLVPSIAAAQAPPGLGTEEFGLSQRELVQAIERTEELIAKCMREQGFQYIAVDHATVRAGMTADKQMPGLSEAEFISRYGFGVATLYTGLPPQLATVYSPAKVGLTYGCMLMVTTGAGCPWFVKLNDPWLSPITPLNNTGPAQVSIGTTGNPTSSPSTFPTPAFRPAFGRRRCP